MTHIGSNYFNLEFFQGKTIFITGGSGFLGKVLVEKLLRSCSGVKTIYLLIESRPDRTSEQRIADFTNLPLFNVLRKSDPGSFDKIKPVEGDVSQLRLGLVESDRQKLIDETDIVYHCAASACFEDTLHDSVLLHTRGTREIANLATEMKSLSVFVHVSSAYCNTDKKILYERLHPPHADWRKTIEIVEKVDGDVLNVISKKFIEPLPNTHVFAKSLGEHVVNDVLVGHVPVVCVRPPIITSSLKEPFSGWAENLDAPIGMAVIAAKGILRSALVKPRKSCEPRIELTPVDIVVKTLILAAWKTAVIDKDKDEMSFYNVCSNNKTLTVKYIVDLMTDKMIWDAPLNNALWFPKLSVTASPLLHHVRVLFYHLLPALLADGLLRVFGQKPVLTQIQRRIYAANNALVYYAMNEWVFINDNTLGLKNFLKDEDKGSFWYEDFDFYEFLKAGTMGARKFLLREDDSTLRHAKNHIYRLWVLSIVTDCLWYTGFFWLLFFKLDILSFIAQQCNNVIVYFNAE